MSRTQIKPYDIIGDFFKLETLNKQKEISDEEIKQKMEEVFPDDFLQEIVSNCKNAINEIDFKALL